MSRNVHSGFGKKYKSAPKSKKQKLDGRPLRGLMQSELQEWQEWINQSWEGKPKNDSRPMVW